MDAKSATLCSLALGMVLCMPAAGADTKQIDANDTTLTYVEMGGGVPVVFVHGALGDYRTWSGEMGDFASHYHAVAYSLRYHYPNRWTEGQYSYQVHIADLVALLQALNLGPVHLVGHSYGGVMAALVAKEHPELVRSLVLAEPSITSLIATNEDAKPLLAEFGKVANAAKELAQKGEPDQAAVTFMDFVNAPGGGFKGLPVAFQTSMLQNTSTLKPLFASPPPPSFTCESAMTIKAPTLLVEGELTQQFRRLVVDELRRCLPHADRAEVHGVGHPLEMVNPKGFNASVLQFLAEH